MARRKRSTDINRRRKRRKKLQKLRVGFREAKSGAEKEGILLKAQSIQPALNKEQLMEIFQKK